MGIIQKIVKFFSSKKHSNEGEKVLTLFNTRDYNRPGHTNYKKCPHCEAEGNTNEEVRELFGFIHSSNHTYIQSWCKDCRKESASKEKNKDKEDLLFEDDNIK